jgi:hypothetical protein
VIKWDLGSLIAALAVVITALSYLASRSREMRMKRTDLVRSYTQDLYSEPELGAIFMDIDHDRLVYGADFLGSPKELALIKMLDYMNSVGHSWRQRVLSLRDIMPTTIAYAILRTWENGAVREYLRQIRAWDEERFASGYGFRYFKDLAITISYIVDPSKRRQKLSAQLLSAPLRPSLRVQLLTRYPWAIGLERLGSIVFVRCTKYSAALLRG